MADISVDVETVKTVHVSMDLTKEEAISLKNYLGYIDGCKDSPRGDVISKAKRVLKDLWESMPSSV